MKLETFFDKFDQFADGPDAVAKMRELVLELAIQGRLTSALPSDGTVPSTIELRESAAALANSLGLRSPKHVVEDLEPPFDVPSHWRWIALADIGAAQTGTTPSKADHGAFNGDIPFIKPADIFPNAIDYSNESLTRHGAENGSRLAPSGSLLMVCIGTIGKCNLIERECAFNQQINSLTPVAAVDSRYLLIAARSRSFLDAARKKSSSTTIAILNKGKWLSIPVPLPPLAEQKRIVAKVDELLALCDRMEAQQQERETRHAALARASLTRFADSPTPANLQFLFHPSYAILTADLRKSILTLAVQGKLVPQDQNYELPAIPSDGQMAGDSEWVSRLQLPDTWLWASLESLLAVLKNGFNGKPSKIPGSFKVTRIETIARETIDLARVGYADDLPDDVVAKHAVLRGDILLSHINSEPHLGKTAICTIDDPTLVHGVNLLLLRPIVGIDSSYLNIALRELRAAGYFVSIAQRAVNQASINQKKLGKTPIPIPPVAEQRRIVAKVDELMALVDALETQLAASRTAAANLVSAAVAELINGKGLHAIVEV
ncbi:restriction endonuclease subunit S [Stenotrophomonas sp. YIM B06876]|uniref:restriction endonuclease subunit S n=1 Tax=Stenotrophomonas sp. YIM B06876 TaxID=3060211 RepID=UPI002739AC04|nr:restriction endonuclease subunit S [Stenotrophomonas sp. YIM B06876]